MEDKRKKVGILNVQWVDNYGAVLLAYALQSAIDSLGFRAEIIDYRPLSVSEHKSIPSRLVGAMSRYGFKGLISKVLKKMRGRKNENVNISSAEKHRKFEDFRGKYLNRSVPVHAISDCANMSYDAYVVGSDVIWKPDRVLSSESDFYFLNFTDGEECRRIAYAASIGTDDKNRLEAIEDKMAEMIQKFDNVSVREKTSVPFVRKLYGRSVEWCIDPTLLLDRKSYDKILDECNLNAAPQRHYIYLYLFENDAKAIDLANRYSNKLNLPIVCQCGMPSMINNLLEYSKDDDPAEFVSRIKNADFVITDSFHGTVFSIVYWKKFVTLSRGKISIRMQNLLERLKLEERYVENPAECELNNSDIDYQATEEIIKAWRSESMEFLSSSLNKIGGG